MRLTQTQISTIVEVVKQFAREDATVYLFGSRLDDRARGGDIDLLIETGKPITLLDWARIKMYLEKKLGLPVDVIIQNRHDRPAPFQRNARSQGVPLEMTSP